MKTCLKCNIEKPLAEFPPLHNAKFTRNVCNLCYRQSQRDKYKQRRGPISQVKKFQPPVLPAETKLCTKCNTIKPWSEFYVNRTGRMKFGLNNNCKVCNRTRNRQDQLKKDYKLSEPEYQVLLAKQSGKCAICGRIPKKALAVDHCHSTEIVRGLLCPGCNIGLGMFRDNVGTLESAIAYLRKYQLKL